MADVTSSLPEAMKRAFAAYERGQLREADRLARAILSVKTDHFDALHLIAVVSARHRRFDEALASYNRALAVWPDCAEAYNNRGATLQELKRLDEALASYDRALVLQPDYAEALNNRGVTLKELKRSDDALASYDRALAIRPDYIEALTNRGVTLKELKRFDEALASYDRALAVRPDYAEALTNRGVTLHELKRFGEALASYDRALAVRPDYAEALNNRGVTLHELKRFGEALTSYDRAIAERPDYAEALTNRGVTLHELKRFDEALANYDRALAERPDYAGAHWNKSLLQLLIGDFARGWREYEWRWKIEGLGLIKQDLAQPLWLGGSKIEGKTILLHSDQGFGDTIQFCRYVPLIAARGAGVLLQVQAPLQELMTSFADVARVISANDEIPHFDLHCPLSSLPLAFGTRIETIPANTPYLTVPSESVRGWNFAPGSKGDLKIGLVWSGRRENTNDPKRSIDLRSLLPLLDVKANFVSLQKDVRPDDATVLKNRSDLAHCGDKFETFSDTAAVISQLDLLISVDTSVAHLAGALAKPVWLLLPFVPEWRWLLDRDNSPWYPTARLFRQTAPGDWSGVVSRVADELKKLLHVHDGRRSMV